MDELDELMGEEAPKGFVMPSSPTDRKAIMDAMMEISASKTRAEGERDFQKEALNDLYDKFKIPKRLLSRFARAYHRQNYTEEIDVDSDFVVMVEILTNSK